MLDINQKKESKTLQTKFGQITIDSTKAIFFSAGLVGIPAEKSYCIVDCPLEKFAQNFKILCSYDNEDLSFLVLPLKLRDQSIYKLDDISPFLYESNYDLDETSILLVASTVDTPEGKKISINLQAPIFIDHAKQTANQCVLYDMNYPIAYIL